MAPTSPSVPASRRPARHRHSWAWWLTGGVVAAVIAGTVVALVLVGLVAALGVLVAGAVLATAVALVVGIIGPGRGPS
ncbi:MAG: hypothetical protein QOD55_2666 [Solirubrobacteraceae bacterium]|nr:hypothetical protein [Solirubrobacteraceae bacterium]MEA2290669.1 hypothetical protein [Solirubrobacteraceae bacterium]